MMNEIQELIFEISDSGNLVRLEPKRYFREGCEIDWDNNWIITTVTVKGGVFSGQFNAEFMTFNFEMFKQELRSLYDNLKGSATFSGMEGQLQLEVVGDGIGHFDVNVEACDQPDVSGSVLTFTMGFDQTSIKELVFQLDRITKQFPIIGDFNIKNE
jgi:hypothetical protein